MTARKALFLVSPVPEAAGAMRGWLDAGNVITEIWYGRPPNPGMIHRDERLALLVPRWSVTGLARRRAIPLREVPPLSKWPEGVELARSTGADLLISCMFSFRVPPELLALFGDRAVNLHPAPLPGYRGPDTTFAMILDGSIASDACVTMHVMAPDFDAGSIIASEPFVFPEAGSLTRFSLRCGNAGHRLAANALPRYFDGELPATPQDETQAAYPKVKSADLAIGPHVDLKTARRIFATLGSLGAVNVTGVPAARATKLSAVLGPPSGRPPTIHAGTIDCDVADARIRMRRNMPWSSACRKLARLVTVMTAAGPGH